MDTVGDRGVIEEKEYVDGMGIGVDQNGLTVNLKGTRGGLAGVRNNAVSNFEAVDIGLILLVAAEGIKDGLGQEKEQICEEKQCWKWRAQLEVALFLFRLSIGVPKGQVMLDENI